MKGGGPSQPVPFGLWHLLQLFEETVTVALNTGRVPEGTIVAALLGLGEAELPEVRRTVAAGVLAAADVRDVVDAFIDLRLRGQPLRVHRLSDWPLADVDLEAAALRVAEEAEARAWDEESGTEPTDLRIGGVPPTEPAIIKWCLHQFLALVVESTARADLDDEAALDLMVTRLWRCPTAHLRWIARVGDLVLSAGGIAILKLNEITSEPSPGPTRDPDDKGSSGE